MGFAPPQHLTFPPNSETVRDEFHWSHRFLGVTEEWAGPVVKRTHFDTDLFSEKGVVKPKYEGRLRLWSRRSSEEDSEYEVWEVSESSRLASQGPTSMHTRRSSDGHVERRFSRSSDTAKQDLILQPGSASHTPMRREVIYIADVVHGAWCCQVQLRGLAASGSKIVHKNPSLSTCSSANRWPMSLPDTSKELVSRTTQMGP
eukprot:2056636-Rhodomonas_salina.3